MSPRLLIDTCKYLYTQHITQSHTQVTTGTHSHLLLTPVSTRSSTRYPRMLSLETQLQCLLPFLSIDRSLEPHELDTITEFTQLIFP